MIRLPNGCAHVVAALDVGRVRLADRVPAHDVSRAPPPDHRRRVHHRVAGVGRPLEAVGRVVQEGPHRRLRVLGPVEVLVPLGRVGLDRVLELRHPFLADDGQDVVVLRSFELHQAEVRALPVDPVLRGGQAHHSGVVLAQDYDARLSAGRHVRVDLQIAAGVPHLEEPLVLLVDDPQRPRVVALPGHLGRDDGVVVGLHGGVQHLPQVGHALDEIVVEEELLGGSDVDQCHGKLRGSDFGPSGYHRRPARATGAGTTLLL